MTVIRISSVMLGLALCFAGALLVAEARFGHPAQPTLGVLFFAVGLLVLAFAVYFREWPS